MSKTVLNSSLPVSKYCYHCKRVVSTKIKYYPSQKTRLMALALSLCFLCWVPLFCSWKAEVDHHCSICDGYLGTFDPNFEQVMVEDLTNALLTEKIEEKKAPQKKYKEAGRRCSDFDEIIRENEDLIKVYSDLNAMNKPDIAPL